MKKINTQKELVEFLRKNPMKTEKEICRELWQSSRGKKHADLIRRALHGGKIKKVVFKIPGQKGRALIHYHTQIETILHI